MRPWSRFRNSLYSSPKFSSMSSKAMSSLPNVWTKALRFFCHVRLWRKVCLAFEVRYHSTMVSPKFSKNLPVVSLSFNTAFSISTVMMPLVVRSELYLSLTSARKLANRPLSLAFRTSPFLAFHSCGVQDMPVEMTALLPSTVMRQSMLAVPSAFTFCLLM